MAIKHTILGLLIYVTIAAYLLACVALMAGRRKVGRAVFVAGFFVAILSFIYRWYDVRHVPLQNLFEVFLFLGMICYPISWFCWRVLRIGGQWTDALIGAVVLVPAGFVFNAEPMPLPPALQSWLFAPHVTVYMLSYIFMAKAAFQAGEQLLGTAGRASSHKMSWRAGTFALPPEQATYELITIGFPLLTLGLVLGSWWGKLAWGDYWGWDPKELWSLASWLAYLGYFHWRYMFGKKHPHINSIWAIAGMLAIIITLLWVNLSRLFPGLHSYAT
jgi:ABC-type transport system involved in cytochrome c biogenesis permease subunit